MKKKIVYKELDTGQKEFIRNKVKELGTISEVEKFYRLDDKVSEFAIKLAKTLFKEEK